MPHAVHDAVFATALKVPLAHAAQVRSTVVVPSLTTYRPVPQVVLGAHQFVGLPSWSQ
ncbi:MAG: hypothetical protein IPG96_16310 [Proteobacteria bacterium]|nr:hypothetical protein [Pseudomonadota bacterium]